MRQLIILKTEGKKGHSYQRSIPVFVLWEQHYMFCVCPEQCDLMHLTIKGFTDMFTLEIVHTTSH